MREIALMEKYVFVVIINKHTKRGRKRNTIIFSVGILSRLSPPMTLLNYRHTPPPLNNTPLKYFI